MNTEMVELAKLFKARENKNQENFVIGEVKSVSPLKVSDGDDILLSSENLYVLSFLLPHARDVQSGKGTYLMNFLDYLKVGEKVALIPSSDGQKYLLIDKVVQL